MISYYDYQLSKVGQIFGYILGFSVQLVLLSLAAGSVSSGNLFAFDVIGIKTHKIAGNNIVTIEIEKSCPLATLILSAKLCHQSSVIPYKLIIIASCITATLSQFSKPAVGTIINFRSFIILHNNDKIMF